MRRAGLALAAALALGMAGAGGTGVFRDVTKASGVSMRIEPDLRRLKLIATMVGGCAMGDYDDDGRPDLYVTNTIPHWGKPNRDDCGRLYRNVGGRFEDVTAQAGVRACGLGMGAFWADLDGDGHLDLYLTNVGPNAVWWNKGDGTFEEGRATGLEDPLFSVGAAFLDFDADGRLDVAVGNYLDSTPEWEFSQEQFELRVPEDYVGQPSRLYRNLGGRKFADVTDAAGLAIPPAETKTLGIAVLDYDGDGRPDLYFVNDRVSNRLFRNRGDGTFEETTAETGSGVLNGGQARAGMGVAVGDPFGGGRDSLFVTNFGAEENSLYRNVEGVLFEDAGQTSGAGPIGLPYVRWGTHFADFDNDGWDDLYAAGGHLAPRMVRSFARYRPGTQGRPTSRRATGRTTRRRFSSTTSVGAGSSSGRTRGTSDGAGCRRAGPRSRTSTATARSISSSSTSTAPCACFAMRFPRAAGSRSNPGPRPATRGPCSRPASPSPPKAGPGSRSTGSLRPTPRARSFLCTSAWEPRRPPRVSRSCGPEASGSGSGPCREARSIACGREARPRI